MDKIVGPGNLFVALAKRHVYGKVDIDSIAGPSEVVVIADSTADPRFLAADLISQAEHSPGASILITWEPSLIDRVVEALEEQLGRLSRGDLARDSLERFGALILVRDEDEAVALSNRIAPEHLHVSTADPERLVRRLTNAGAIFLGHDTPVAAGDYAAGPSHVLPDRRHRAMGLGPLGQRLPQAVEPDRALPRRARRARPRHPPPRRQGRAHRSPLSVDLRLDGAPTGERPS